MSRINQQTGMCEKNKKNMGNKGFTLVELVIALVMIGILSAIAYPSLGKWRTNMAMKKNSRDILFAIKAARMKAINLNKKVSFNIDPLTGAYSVVDEDGAVYIKDNIGKELSVINNTIGNTFEFDTKGMPSATGGFDFQTITGDNYRGIDLYLTGIVKLR